MTANGIDKDTLSGWGAYKRLLVYVREYRLAILVSILGYVLYAATQAAMAALMKFLPDALEQTSDEPPEAWFLPEVFRSMLGSAESYQYFLPLALIIIVAFRGLGSYFGAFYMVLVARNVVNNLRKDMFNRLLILPGSFYNRNTSGHLISTLTYNTEQVTGAATDALKILFREGFTVIGLLFYVFYVNWTN